jgi:hypothetical protein
MATAMKTIPEMSARELVELNYRVAYYIAQNAMTEGTSPSTIRANTREAEEFERRLADGPSDQMQLAAIHRVAKWIGIEDAIAGRAENPQIDDFGEIAPCLYEPWSRSVRDLPLSLAGEDDDSGSMRSIY